MIASADTYFVVVVEDLNTHRLVGCATVVLEKKFTHTCTTVYIL